jgi:ATP dependent DNA ligase domain
MLSTMQWISSSKMGEAEDRLADSQDCGRSYLNAMAAAPARGTKIPARLGMASRDQARRLPAVRPARGQAGAGRHQERPRLDRPLSAAALKNRASSFVIDGEAVLLGVHGSDFDGLHGRQQDDEMQLYAFDILAADGEDLRKLPLSMRKANLDRLLARRPDGIFVAPFEQGEIGPDLFRKACEFGLVGLVSKHCESRASDTRI